MRLLGENWPLLPVQAGVEEREHFRSTFWGQSCDSMDNIAKDIQHPLQHLGEWVVTPDFGSYSRDCATSFNGFGVPEQL